MSFERSAGTVRRRWTVLAIAYVLFALVFVGPVAYSLASHHVSSATAAAVFAGYLSALGGVGYAWQRLWRRTRGRITADGRGLFVDDELLVSRPSLKHAYVLNDRGCTYLRLVRHGRIVRPIDVEVTDEAEARKLLAALRFDPQSSVAEFMFTEGTPKSDARKVGGIFAAMMIALSLALGLFAIGLKHPGNALPAIAGSLLVYLLGSGGAIFALGTRHVRIKVGADGVYLRRLLAGPRFISFRDLADVSLEGVNITLCLSDGSAVAVHHLGEGRPQLGYDREREGAALVARIREARAAYLAAPPTTAHALGRGARSATEWIAQARALREDTAAYRAAAVPDEQLWRIVEDASAAATERAGAALALRRDLDDAGRRRLRLAAEACAETRLRVALETATAQDDDALALALEPLEDVPARRMALP